MVCGGAEAKLHATKLRARNIHAPRWTQAEATQQEASLSTEYAGVTQSIANTKNTSGEPS